MRRGRPPAGCCGLLRQTHRLAAKSNSPARRSTLRPRNASQYPHPQHRWVEFSGAFVPNCEVDPSRVPPEWHGWLHSTVSEPPTATTIGSVHRHAPLASALGSSTPFARNLGGVQSAFVPNLSQMRPRGFGLDNGMGANSGTRSRVNEEAFYTPPGYALAAGGANRSRFASARRARMRFSLLDTPLTLQAKGAARAGLSLDEFQSFTDDEHPTKALLLLTGGSISREEGARIAASAAESGDAGALVEEALAGMPAEPAKRDLAARLALALPVTRADKGSFAAAAAAELSAEEAAAVAEGGSAEAAREVALVHQKYIEAYSGIDMKEARRGVAAAVEVRDAALAKLAVLRRAEAKLAALRARFDERAFAMAREAQEQQAQQLA